MAPAKKATHSKKGKEPEAEHESDEENQCEERGADGYQGTSEDSLNTALSYYRRSTRQTKEAMIMQEEAHHKECEELAAKAKASAQARAPAPIDKAAEKTDHLTNMVAELQLQFSALQHGKRAAQEPSDSSSSSASKRSRIDQDNTASSQSSRTSLGTLGEPPTSVPTTSVPVFPPAPSVSTNTENNTYVKWTTRCADPTDKLTGRDTDAYFIWRFAVESKLQVDAPLYPTEDLRIRYAMQQLDHPVFPFICSWFAKAESPSLSDFFVQLEHYLGTKHLASKAEVELDDIHQESSETVSAFYYRIQILWDRANPPGDLRYRMFVRKLKPDLVDGLRAWIISQGENQKDLSKLLEAARTVEGPQNNIDAFQKKRVSSSKGD
ncbi:hypothetical protein KEM55_000902 [Ascosphaera atra]|nr:hypothetical protein KEM55_000902 [Ascosphaera atra]